MSRLDYVTIGIIVVCAAALVILIWKTISFRNKEKEIAQQNTENTLQDYNYDYYQDTTQILPPTDEDPDDDEVEVYNENKTDNEPATSEAKNTSQSNTPANASEESSASSTSSRSSGDYLVLAGAFSVKNNAENEARRLQKLGFPNAEVSPFNRGKYAAVLVDRFSSESDAKKLVNDLKAKGVEAYVHQQREQE
ncbi:MAG: SPOR domain-containing protein [Saprospiraceae bacterium]|nr:SPOR domain-containing protein [Saprospiraceae bacterium]